MKSIRNKKRLIALVYVMGAYLVFQLAWWGFQLFQLHKQNLDYAAKNGQSIPVRALASKVYMIVGEGVVFLAFLALGFWWIRKNVWRDLQSAQKEKTFLLAVTHELKTPVAAIKLNAQTLINRELTHEQQKKVHSDIQKEANRLNKLVNNVLMATQFENNSIHKNLTEFNLSSTIDQLIGRFQLLHPSRIIQSNLEQNISWVSDEELLVSAVSNLIENADKYSPSEKPIAVNLFLRNSLPTIEVIDEGQGIPEEEKSLVFKKFYRLGDENRRVSKGTGLGLFIVKEICTHLNASVQIADNTKGGTRFIITFKS